MIGNDLVDLEMARQESNWRRKGFLQKLFTSHEQHLIDTATDPERMVWTLWSMKEGAYKATFRQTRLRRFAPQTISCQLSSITETEATGHVFYEMAYQTQTVYTPNYIASLAFATDSSSYRQSVVPLERTDYLYQSAQTRQKLLHYCSRLLAVPVSSLHIRQQDCGVPDLIVERPYNSVLTIPVSLSHHGRYGAFAIGWPIP